MHDAWRKTVARRASQIAADVGAASPRGPLKQIEVSHIIKSVARWVWEQYVAGVPPLLREAQIAAHRELEHNRQKAREAARDRSRMTRDDYTAPARQRRSEATELRRSGLSLRSIAAALQPLPVPTTAFYSKSDGVVNWRASIVEPGDKAENIEVYASHIGLGVSPSVLWAIADRLAQPEGTFAPFARLGPLRSRIHAAPPVREHRACLLTCCRARRSLVASK